ncbi:Carbon catabolite repressor protein 4 homolog 1 [Striga hermonthica]|uniref:poly(A)-specific ribonuclease n=1 Tax=Striga hermonthica TaxID=68872 RepID=A0A9N7NTD2_STRHE|nr:Carbon catabolite repressor protein 4 homolog 1 [Striga hermonthica]
MVSVVRVHFPSDIPIVGCELTPYVQLKRTDNSVVADDATESNPIDGHFLQYRWYRVQNNKTVCSVHPTEQATVQCIGCCKAKLPVAQSYHCSNKCFADAWQHHRVLHERAALKMVPRTDGEIWFEVGNSKTYTPTADDIGHILKFECVVVDVETREVVASPEPSGTDYVISAPSPSPRRVISVSGVDIARHMGIDRRSSSGMTFSVLSYNILSDIYASTELYSYCPLWALPWSYRRQNLLREIVGYQADIICLQEVQSDHFEEFFAPELDKHGYQAVFKSKSGEVFGGIMNTIDGCATFFRRDRFALVKKYEVEFNTAAQSLTNALVPSSQKNNALNRLIKDNISLIIVLEAKFGGIDNPGKRQLVCVANTHVHVHQELKDVKLWQVHTLMKGLEKIAATADIPMLVCGDFNSVPGSAPHALLAFGRVDPFHPDLAVDPLGILRPIAKLTHQLPLVSAYSSFVRATVGLGLEQRRKMDLATNEPLYTSWTRDFIGTHDYIFYSADTLTVESLLELLDEDILRKNTALPSPEWSSDHMALFAEFRYKPKRR